MLRHGLAVFQTYVSHSFVLLLGVSLFEGKLVILMALVLAYNLFKHLFVNCAMCSRHQTQSTMYLAMPFTRSVALH